MFYKSGEVVIVIYVISFVLLIIMVGLIAYLITGVQKRQFLHIKKMEELKNRQHSEILQAQLEIQEQTFENISREIHDNIGQKLTLAKLHLNTLPPFSNSSKANEQVAASIEMLGEVILDLSDLSRSMNSEILLQNGLIKAIEFEVGQLAKAGFYKISTRIIGDPEFMSEEIELMIFRIIQECLNNIVKHSAATELFIELHFVPGALKVTVEDNGKGFNKSQVRGKGIGLMNMENRATLINGKLTFSPGKVNGTKVELEIPLYDKV